MTRLTRMLLCLFALATFGGAVAGCSTTEGFGKDVEAGGKAIKDSAREHSN